MNRYVTSFGQVGIREEFGRRAGWNSRFALTLALFPATAAIVGAIVLGQVPRVIELGGIGLVMLSIALTQGTEARPSADDGAVP